MYIYTYIHHPISKYKYKFHIFFFKFQRFCKLVYTSICVTYSNVVDYQWQFGYGLFEDLWRLVLAIQLTRHMTVGELSALYSLVKKASISLNFYIKNCFSHLSFSWIFVFFITFQDDLSIDDDLIPVTNPGKRIYF